MQIISHRKIYFTLSGALAAASIAVVAIFGLNYGIDFTGGSLMQIKVADKVETDAGKIQELLTSGESKKLEAVIVQPAGERGYILRFKSVNEDEHQAILSALNAGLSPLLSKEGVGGGSGGAGNKSGESSKNPKPSPAPLPGREGTASIGSIQAVNSEGKPVDIKVEPASTAGKPGVVAQSPTTTIGGEQAVGEEIFESVGPTIGAELKRKSFYAIGAVLIAIILYIAWAFRKVSQPVASWKYGVVAVVALAHDVIIPTGVFAVLGKLAGVEIDILFVTAILTMLGFSVHDTIVVFDRTRENLAHRLGGSFEEVVNRSVNETLRRSIYTSATAFLALLAIYFFGGESVKYFVLALMLGIVVGTYSSIFIASPLLVVWERWGRK